MSPVQHFSRRFLALFVLSIAWALLVASLYPVGF
jgi:hypothetical protein